MAPMASGAGTSRHRAICTFSACAMLALVQPAWPGDGGGEGAERAIGSGQEATAPRKAAKPGEGSGARVTEITQREFGNLGQRDLSRIRSEMIGDGTDYRIEGFSDDFTLMLVSHALSHPRSARSLIEEMRRRTTRAERDAYLQQELSRANVEIEALRKSVKKLDQDKRAFGKNIGLNTAANAQYNATLRLSTEEENRLTAAEYRREVLRAWRRNPDEGLLPK